MLHANSRQSQTATGASSETPVLDKSRDETLGLASRTRRASVFRRPTNTSGAHPVASGGNRKWR